MKKIAPRLCRLIFRWFIPEWDQKQFFRILDEAFLDFQRSRGKPAAALWYWMQLAKSLPSFLTHKCGGYLIMLKTHLKTGIRCLQRNRGYSILNILGLAVGLTVSILIFLWVQDELSYDRFHVNAHRIYRTIEHEQLSNGDVLSYSQQAPALAAVLKSNFPEIEDAVRFEILSGRLVRFQELEFYEDGFGFTDPAFLSVFTFPLKTGDPVQVLQDPSSMVISEKIAHKYFGNDDPIGKVLQIDNSRDFVVSGVLKDVPANSHLQFDFLVPFDSIQQFGRTIQGWDFFYLDTYVLLSQETDYLQLNPKIRDIIIQNSDDGAELLLDLQPLTRIRLFSNTILTPQVEGDIKYVLIFSLIALFVLLNACINFMNLTTARSGQRAREIGIRKTVGARREELVGQFFGESMLLTFFSLILALFFVILMLPFFNQLSGKSLSLHALFHIHTLLGLLVICLSTGLLSGIYPALMLSSFKPALVLKSSRIAGPGGGAFRRSLVMFQFIMTTVLIIGTLVVYRQLNFLHSQDLGFDKEQMVSMRLPRDLVQKLEMMNTALEKVPGVLSTAAASTEPGEHGPLITLTEWQGRVTEDRIELGLVQVSDGFLETFKLEMAEGRFFSQEFTSDEEDAVIVNQAAVQAMHMQNPLGKEILGAKIIGVIKNFHLRSLHFKVAPVAFIKKGLRLQHLFIKLASPNISRTLANLDSAWQTLAPGYPFEFHFLDDKLEELYHSDQSLGRIIKTFAGLALFVACLGLFGMASFVAERRTKEIGIRKILGASTPLLFTLLARDFLKWILLANVIASPLAAYASLKYLKSYAYRIDLGVTVFIIPALIILGIALVTISWQVLKAAAVDPVHSLRYE